MLKLPVAVGQSDGDTHTHTQTLLSLLCVSIIDGHTGFPLSHLFSALPLCAPFGFCLQLRQTGMSIAMLSNQSVNPS